VDFMQTLYVDCRPRDAYLAGHIPGAAHADPETDLTGDVGGGRHPLPSAEQFAAWASSAGIGPGTHVVAYDDGTGWGARLWWLLRHYGHDDAEAIRLADWEGELAAGEETIEPATFEPRERTDDTAGAQELLGRLGSDDLTLVDARAPERWRGETEPIDPVAGRIPGARNRFFLDESPLPQELLDAPDLVVYCGSGVTACAVLHELHRAGRDDARLYPGSFSEWYSLGPVERD
jgi:thiosulfate/3-mercaptopyruvate sulfurtransferase